MSNDYLITNESASGQLELNSFYPIIVDSILDSSYSIIPYLYLLKKCIKGIKINKQRCEDNLNKSTALTAALINHIGYDKASEVAKAAMNASNRLFNWKGG